MFSPWHRVQPYTLSVWELNGSRLMAVEKLTTRMALLLTPRQWEAQRERPSAERPPCRNTPNVCVCVGSVCLNPTASFREAHWCPHSTDEETKAQQGHTIYPVTQRKT